MKTSRLNIFTFIFALLVLLTVAACGAGPQAITQSNPGQARDTIFSVEPRLNGTFTVWLTHDDVGAYCSSDPAILAQAKAIFEDETRIPDVILTYRSVNWNEAEGGGFLGLNNLSSACGSERGSDETIKYLLISIRRLGGDTPQ